MSVDSQSSRGGQIQLKSVTKRYGRERVVDSVSAEIAPGEFFSLLGPSGSGKTTTLMMIAGFADVDEGGIWVDGQDVSALAPQRRGFGMVFQNYAIFPHLNVFENVAFPLRARRVRDDEIKQRVQAALELVRLERFADRFSRQLSGGQQQRVAIARAIVYQPKVVLMDEPLGALDKNLRYQMQVEIKQIQQRLGMTVVYVTHDQEEAMNMSDRIAIMNNGRIEQVGEPACIYDQPANEFVARFLGEANLLAGTCQGLESESALVRLTCDLVLRARREASTVASSFATTGAPTSASEASLGALKPGERASFFIRPERLRLSTTQPDSVAAACAVQGRLMRTSFLGNILRHDIEIAPGVVLTADEQNVGASPATQPGQMLWVSWQAQDAAVLAG